MKFISLKKRSWFHNHDPFQRMMKNRLSNLVAASPNPSAKTLFTSPVLNQEDTPYCGENEACAEQAAVDGRVYDVLQFLNGVLGYLNETIAQYVGADMKTLAAASISPGWTPMGQTTPTINATAVLWITPENGIDLYDTIQTYITQYQRPAFFGTTWYTDWIEQANGLIVTTPPNQPMGGHCTMACGKVKSGYMGVAFSDPDRFDNQGSWGTDAPGSINGHYLFPRSIVNQYWGLFGVGMRIFSTDRTVIILGLLSADYIKLIDLLGSLGARLTKK